MGFVRIIAETDFIREEYKSLLLHFSPAQLLMVAAILCVYN